MKHTISSADLQLLNTGLSSAGVQLSAEKSDRFNCEIACSFINNEDGTLRWLWPASSRNASFLRFYHTGKTKYKYTAMFVRFCILLGLGKFVVSGKVKLYAAGNTAKLLSDVDDWALYTGVVSETRKLIFWYKKSEDSNFAKLPTTAKAVNNIYNEYHASQAPSVEGVHKPEAKIINDFILVQKDIFQSHTLMAPASVYDLPANILRNWILSGIHVKELKHTTWWNEARHKYADHVISAKEKNADMLLERLAQMINLFNDDDKVLVCEAHGDFTSGNIRSSDSHLSLVDWELHSNDKGVLYDLFHFIYHDAVLTRGLSFSSIRNEVDKYFSQPDWSEFTFRNGIDIKQAEQLYLLDIVSYYLDLYSRQDVFPVKVQRLLDTWFEAMGYWLYHSGLNKAQETVVADMVQWLKDVPYAVLKLNSQDIRDIQDSDLDICMHNNNAEQLLKWLKAHCLVKDCGVQKRSFIKRVTLTLQDGTQLNINLISEIKRKNLVFMNINEILDSAVINKNGIKVPLTLHDMTYVCLYHLLNRSSVPVRYKQWFAKAMLYKVVCDMLIRKFQLNTSQQELFVYERSRYFKILSSIKSNRENTGLRYLKNTLLYVIDTLKGIWNGNLILQVSAPDTNNNLVMKGCAAKMETELHY